ncbi:hypothetical protein BZA77DRAFT_305887 [Pyronema omphalodes]|nr:hypothetical protein BZA77DRAFT_305887 [Pyronema omphalodes]
MGATTPLTPPKNNDTLLHTTKTSNGISKPRNANYDRWKTLSLSRQSAAQRHLGIRYTIPYNISTPILPYISPPTTPQDRIAPVISTQIVNPSKELEDALTSASGSSPSSTTTRRTLTLPIRSPPSRLNPQPRHHKSFLNTADAQVLPYELFPSADAVEEKYLPSQRTMYSRLAIKAGLPVYVVAKPPGMFRHPVTRFYPEAPSDPGVWLRGIEEVAGMEGMKGIKEDGQENGNNGDDKGDDRDGDDEVYYACQLDITPFRSTKLRKPGKELLSKTKRVQLQKLNLRGMMQHRQGGVEMRVYNGASVCGGVPFCYKQTRECVSGVEMDVEELKMHLRVAHGLRVTRVVDIESEWETEEKAEMDMEVDSEIEGRMQ